MRKGLVVLMLVVALVLAVAVPALAFVHVRIPGDDCGGGATNDTAGAAITSQDRPGSIPPLGSQAPDEAPDDTCPADR